MEFTQAKFQELVAENAALKLELSGYHKRVCSMCDGHGMVGNCIDSMDCPYCVKLENSIKADAVEEAANKLFRDGCHSHIAALAYANKIRFGNGR